jgi:hypothetical protein
MSTNGYNNHSMVENNGQQPTILLSHTLINTCFEQLGNLLRMRHAP